MSTHRDFRLYPSSPEAFEDGIRLENPLGRVDFVWFDDKQHLVKSMDKIIEWANEVKNSYDG